MSPLFGPGRTPFPFLGGPSVLNRILEVGFRVSCDNCTPVKGQKRFRMPCPETRCIPVSAPGTVVRLGRFRVRTVDVGISGSHS